ncbi:MAG: glycosyltransferase family 2 protein, partial [bacterium]|nr:glycosyltransferase family 2 protein [bacterium]
MSVCIFVPVYNEEKTILKVVEELFNVFKDFDFEVIVVDDGSTDSTYELLKGLNKTIKLIRNNKNIGKGASLRVALNNTVKDIFAIQDADNEYKPKELKMLVNYLIENNLDCVFGSRFLKKNPNIYPHYMIGNKILTSLINIFEPFGHVSDAYTCYKVFKTEKLKSMNLFSNRFEIEAELVMKV